MQTGADRPAVAVLNMSEEIVRLLELALAVEGFRPVSADPVALKRGRQDLAAFLAEARPAVVIWDIAAPYDENWAYFGRVVASAAGRDCRFVVTTPNKRALEEVFGPTPAREIVGKPYDLGTLIDAVRRALDAGAG